MPLVAVCVLSSSHRFTGFFTIYSRWCGIAATASSPAITSRSARSDQLSEYNFEAEKSPKSKFNIYYNETFRFEHRGWKAQNKYPAAAAVVCVRWMHEEEHTKIGGTFRPLMNAREWVVPFVSSVAQTSRKSNDQFSSFFPRVCVSCSWSTHEFDKHFFSLALLPYRGRLPCTGAAPGWEN